jgi:ABC-type multidrug transport system ATPase subunit
MRRYASRYGHENSSPRHSGLRIPEDISTVAVDDVSFEVYDGEIFGLIGPNGAISRLVRLHCTS